MPCLKSNMARKGSLIENPRHNLKKFFEASTQQEKQAKTTAAHRLGHLIMDSKQLLCSLSSMVELVSLVHESRFLAMSRTLKHVGGCQKSSHASAQNQMDVDMTSYSNTNHQKGSASTKQIDDPHQTFL